MCKQNDIDLLQQAIRKTQEASEALEILKANGIALDCDAYTSADDHINEVLSTLYHIMHVRKEVEEKAEIEKIRKQLLLKWLRENRENAV